VKRYDGEWEVLHPEVIHKRLHKLDENLAILGDLRALQKVFAQFL